MRRILNHRTDQTIKFITAILFTTLLAFSLRAGTATIEGEIQLDYSSSSFSDKTFKKEFGDVVKATAKWYVGDFFGEETVHAGISVENTGDKPMYFHYYVAFFDKNKKLVGAAAQGSFDALKPGRETQLGSCLIQLPKDRYKDIVSYQAMIYETDIAPSKK